MKLQLALDDITLDDALALLDRVQGDVDVAEVGTPMVIEYGMEPVRRIKERFPQLEVLADLKIMDAGRMRRRRRSTRVRITRRCWA